MLANGTALMGAAGLGQMGAGIAGAVGQANAQRMQGDYQKMVGDTNARLATMQAQDATTRGDRTAGQIQRQGKQMIGSQRAALAAQGVDVNSGSAADVQAGTAAMTAHDALTAKNNAWREAWGYQVQANQSSAAGQFAKIAGDSSANNTILTGGMQALSTGLKTGYEIYQNGSSESKGKSESPSTRRAIPY